MRIFIISIAVFFSINIAAQQSVESALATMKSQIEQKKSITVNDDIFYVKGNGDAVLSFIQKWMSDSLSSVRSNAAVITGRLAIFTSENLVREKCINMLFRAGGDRDVAIGNVAVQYLKQVKSQYFTNEHKEMVGSFLGQGNSLIEDFLYLAGYMYANNQISNIESLVSAGSLNRKELWQANLALARMGGEKAILASVSTANSTPLGDGFIKIIVPGLIYTKQKDCTDVLVSLLNNNEKACTPPNPEYSGSIPCRYRIVEALATVVDDFPVKVTSEGDLITDDYEGALKTAIKWFAEHKDYKFKQD